MNRIFDAKLRKVGNSYVVTIPKDSIDRFRLKDGDYIEVSFNPDEVKRKKTSR